MTLLSKRLIPGAAILVLVALVASGLGRINFNVQVLALLPQDIPAVQGLSAFLKHFQKSTELVALLESDSPETVAALTTRFIAELRSRPDLVRRVVAAPPAQNDPNSFAELAVFLLLNSPPDRIAHWLTKLSPENIPHTLSKAADAIQRETDPARLALLAYDPLGIGDLLAIESAQWAADLNDGGFASSDGRTRIAYLEAPRRLDNYREAAKWLAQVRTIGRNVLADVPGSTIRFTGEPAFVSEIATGMERDMWFSGLGSLVFIGFIFRLTFRTFRPLLLLLACLSLTFAVTLGICGWVLGAVTAISAGFAAILIGLSVDYAFLVYRHRQTPGVGDWRACSRACLPGIAWAALTTALAFFALSFSALPGLGQLGALVAVGILVGAVIMLTVFPWLCERLASRKRFEPDIGRIEPVLANPAVNQFGFMGTVILFAFCILALPVRGLPRVETSTSSLRPRGSEAYSTLDRVSEVFGVAPNISNYIVTGPDVKTAGRRLSEFLSTLDRAAKNGQIAGYVSPLPFWPDPARQQANLGRLLPLYERLPSIVAAAEKAGFEEEALSYFKQVLGTLHAWRTRPTPILPESEAARWIMAKTVNITPEECAILVSVRAAPSIPLAPALSDTGLPVDWSQLNASLTELLPRELAVLGGLVSVGVGMMLVFALRSWRRALLTLFVVLSTLLALLGAMAWLGLTWNLFSLATVLLLCGMGVDYAIHFLHAQTSGRPSDPVRGVLVLCGLSTTAGFASISTASNLGLASLGATCALGIFFLTLFSVFILPVASRSLTGSASVSA